MEAVLLEIMSYDVYGRSVNPPKVTERHIVSGDSLNELFRNGYRHERSLRYISGRYTMYEDPKIQEKYLEWKRGGGVDISLYYGGGVVD